MRTNGEAIFVLVALSSASHHQLQTKSFIFQAKPKFRKKPAKHFFDAVEPVGNKHAAPASITAEGVRPTTPRNQHRSLPFSCFSFNNFIKTNKQTDKISSRVYLQFFEAQKRRQERVISSCSVSVTERTVQPHPSESWTRSILMHMSWSVVECFPRRSTSV